MELIKEPNPAFNKSLFLESLAGLEDPIKIRINYVGNVFISKMNGSPNFFVEMEILTDFPNCKVLDLDLIGRTQYNEDGSKKVTKINAKDEIIGFPYPLVPTREPEVYKISNKTNLFSLANYAFIKKGIVPAGNRKGFDKVSFKTLKEALTGLELKVTSVLHEKTQYKPYYKLIPVE